MEGRIFVYQLPWTISSLEPIYLDNLLAGIEHPISILPPPTQITFWFPHGRVKELEDWAEILKEEPANEGKECKTEQKQSTQEAELVSGEEDKKDRMKCLEFPGVARLFNVQFIETTTGICYVMGKTAVVGFFY